MSNITPWRDATALIALHAEHVGSKADFSSPSVASEVEFLL